MKYKKIIVSILSLTFLAGCGGKNQSTTSPETTPTDTTTLPETKPSEELPSVSLPEEGKLDDAIFESLKKAYEIKGFEHTAIFYEGFERPISLKQGLFVSQRGKLFSRGVGDLVLKDQSLKTPSDIKSIINIFNSYYSKNADGNLEVHALSMSNNVLSQVVTNNEQIPVPFFKNPFSFASAKDFVRVDEFEPAENRKYAYEFTQEAAQKKNLLNAFGQFILGGDLIVGANDPYTNFQLYTDGTSVTGLEIIIGADPNKVTGQINAPSTGRRFAFDIVSAGDDVHVDEVKAVTGTPDADLQMALRKLTRAKSYSNHATLTSSDGTVTDIATLSVSEKAAVFDYAVGTDVAYLETELGLLGGSRELETEPYVKAVMPDGARLIHVLPDLSLSPLLFDKEEDGSYTLMMDVTALSLKTDYSRFINTQVSLDELKISLNGDDIVITSKVSSDGQSATFIETYTKIDATTVTLTEEDFVDPAPLGGVLGLLDVDSREWISQYIDLKHLELVPAFEGHTSITASNARHNGSLVPAVVAGFDDADKAQTALQSYTALLEENPDWIKHSTEENVWYYKDKLNPDTDTITGEHYFKVEVMIDTKYPQYIYLFPSYSTNI